MSHTVTITISNPSHYSLIKQGEVLKSDSPFFGKKNFVIVTDNSKGSCISLRALSNNKLIRKIQILYYRTKFIIQKKKEVNK